ncbi:hypothetical protein K8I28_11810 [bacterium]|nr:hypothetical protein [bacterium]
MSIRILQASGLKLGAPVLPSGHGFSEDIVRQREALQNSLLSRIVTIAQDQNVDLLILNGDLFDFSSFCLPTIRSVISTLNTIQETAVVIVPGVSDNLSELSPYKDIVSTALGLNWGEHRHILSDVRYSNLSIETLPDLMISFYSDAESTIFESQPAPVEGKINILVCPSAGNGKVDLNQYNKAGFQWVIVSGSGYEEVFSNETGDVLAVDSGEVFQNSFEHPGSGKVAVYEVDENGIKKDTLDYHTIDPTKLLTIQVDLPLEYDDQTIDDIIKTQIEKLDVTFEDILWIKFTGKHIEGPFARFEINQSLNCNAFFIDTSSVEFPGLEKIAVMGDVIPEIAERFQLALELKLEKAGLAESEKVALRTLAYQYGISALRGKTPYPFGESSKKSTD